MNPRNILRSALGLVIAGAVASCAWAQYPDRAVRLVVPFPPGGGADILARSLAPKLSEQLRQQVVVENRPGANGAIGFQAVASAPPDGYTLLLAHLSGFAVNPLLSKVAYDPVKDFAPVAMLASTPSVLIVHPSFPANSVKELIDRAKAGATLTYGTPGNGNPNHIAGELFKSATGVSLVHAPYKGAALVINDLIGGHIPLAFVTLPAALSHVRSGKAKALGLTAEKRSAAAPDIPTMAESGVTGVEYSEWLAIVAPGATPRPVIMRLSEDINAAMRAPDLAKRLAEQALEPQSSTPDAFAALIRGDIERLGKVIRQAGIKAE